MTNSNKASISELKDYIEQEVTLSGWLYKSRSSGKVQFLIIRDGTGLCQCIVEKGKVSDELFEQLRHLGQESSLTVTGVIRAEQRSVGGYELAVTGAEIIGPAEGYPITPKSHGVDFLLKHRHLHFRSQRQWCIGRIRHTVIDAIRRFFNDNGYILIDTPIFTTIVGEDQESLFEVDYFGSPLHLTQTGQLYQPPFYRFTYSDMVDILTGQKSKDFLARQLQDLLNQKQQIEAKIAELEAQQSGSMKQWKKDKIAAELIELRTTLAETDTKIENNPKHAQLAAEFQWGKDLGGSDETIISQMHDKPVFVTHYPKGAKAFYMKTDRSNEKVVLNFDLLAPEGFGEIIGGSTREDDHDRLLAKINAQGLNPETYNWYLDLRKYGSVPHGGFGLGLERTVAWITAEKHIRQCIPFPRMTDKVYI